MNKKELIAQILENAKIINQLHERQRQAWKKHATNPQAFKEASHAWHSYPSTLAFPGGFEQLEALRQNDRDAIAYAIIYLEADPYFFRSGYIKAKVAHMLKHVPLTKQQTYQLQQILLASLNKKYRREFREYCRLARVVADELFINELQKLLNQSNAVYVKQRAQQMLDIINS